MRDELEHLLVGFIRRSRAQAALVRCVESLAIFLNGAVGLTLLARLFEFSEWTMEAGGDVLIAAAFLRILPAAARLFDPKFPILRAALRIELCVPELQQRVSTSISIRNPHHRFAEQLRAAAIQSLRDDPRLVDRCMPWARVVQRTLLISGFTAAVVLIAKWFGNDVTAMIPLWWRSGENP